jgi:hypothetical protein
MEIWSLEMLQPLQWIFSLLELHGSVTGMETGEEKS